MMHYYSPITSQVSFMHHAEPIGLMHSQRIDMMHQSSICELLASQCIMATNEHEALRHHAIVKGLKIMVN